MTEHASGKDDTQAVAENAPEQDDASAIWAELKEATAKADASSEDRAEAKEEASPTPAETAGEAQTDVWATVPEAARQEYDALVAEKAKLEQRIRSDSGRLAARQRKINELRAQAAPVARQAAIDTAPLNDLENDYPEIAQPLKSTVHTINSKVEALEADKESRRKAAESELRGIIDEETGRLDEAFPGWMDFLKANGAAYQGWIEDQPKRIREINERNANEITDADAAIEVLTAFKQFLEPKAPTQTQNPTTPSTDRRQRQLAASSSPATVPRGAVVSGIPEDGDPEAIWNMFRDQERRRAS